MEYLDYPFNLHIVDEPKKKFNLFDPVEFDMNFKNKIRIAAPQPTQQPAATVPSVGGAEDLQKIRKDLKNIHRKIDLMLFLFALVAVVVLQYVFSNKVSIVPTQVAATVTS